MIIGLAVVGRPAPARASAAEEEAYQKARADYLELVRDEKRREFRHHWNRITTQFDRSAERLPKGRLKCEATYNSGRAFQDLAAISYLQSDRDEGIRRFRLLAERCPDSTLADDALYHAATLGARAHPDAARRDLEALISRYPKGDMAPAARVLLAELPKGKSAAAVATTPKASPAAPPVAKAPPSKPVPKAAAVTPASEPKAGPPAAVGATRPESPPKAAAAAIRTPAQEGIDRGAASARTSEEDAVAGSSLPSAVEILAALDAKGADAFRPEDVALARDLQKDEAARARANPAGAERPKPAAIGAPKPDPERLHALEGALGGDIPLSLAAGLKVKRVVLDAGHGGKDTGAIAKDGTKEKDITLSITRRLKKRLEAIGLEVILTRDSDVFLSLEERTTIANDHRADLFLSIHVNAATNRKAYGIETYTLNLNSDRYAMRLAARENATSTRSVGDLDLILADLTTKANTDDSVRLARHAQGQMTGQLRAKYGGAIKDLGVKQALFFVLVGAKMPAILLETGFISHADESKRLRTTAYQEELAKSIADGVRRFIEEREAIARGDVSGQSIVF